MTYLKTKLPYICRMKVEAGSYHWIKEKNLALCRKLQGMNSWRTTQEGLFMNFISCSSLSCIFSISFGALQKFFTEGKKTKQNKTTLSWHFYRSTATRYMNQTNEKKAYLSPRTPEAKKSKDWKTIIIRKFYKIPKNDVNERNISADSNC